MECQKVTLLILKKIYISRLLDEYSKNYLFHFHAIFIKSFQSSRKHSETLLQYIISFFNLKWKIFKLKKKKKKFERVASSVCYEIFVSGLSEGSYLDSVKLWRARLQLTEKLRLESFLGIPGISLITYALTSQKLLWAWIPSCVYDRVCRAPTRLTDPWNANFVSCNRRLVLLLGYFIRKG